MRMVKFEGHVRIESMFNEPVECARSAWIDLDAVQAATLFDGHLSLRLSGASYHLAKGAESDRIAAVLDEMAEQGKLRP